MSTPALPIPVLLLKTRSRPDDTYEERFARPSQHEDLACQSPAARDTSFAPRFIPVLEHTQHELALANLKSLLRDGRLKQKYGGMIFTSQRAVEAWVGVVDSVEANAVSRGPSVAGKAGEEKDPFADLESLTPFPLYVVGPATERALQTLSTQCQDRNTADQWTTSTYSRLNTSIHGANTGNGANLAAFILNHYNQIYNEHWYTYFEAPRLPFIPLLGMSSQNYGRKRLDGNDPRLEKKPLLFLVGEVRRDIIPKTLQGHPQEDRRIMVEEVEVYRTDVMKSFGQAFDAQNTLIDLGIQRGSLADIKVVVVFSPQGSDIMLQMIGYLDDSGQPTQRAENRWWKGRSNNTGHRWVVVTIGPTTRDYLIDELSVEPDVCAEKPSPEGLRAGIEAFLREKAVW